MTREEAYNLLCEIKKTLDDAKHITDQAAIYRLKNFMTLNPTDNLTIEIMRTLGKWYCSQYDFDAIQRAFSLSDNLPYYKQQEIFKVIPFLDKKQYYKVIKSLLYYDHNVTGYEMANDIVRFYLNTDKYDILFGMINNFLDCNVNLRISTKKRYDGIATEYGRLRNFNNKIIDEADYANFEKEEKLRNKHKNINSYDYKNHLCGKVGEYLVWHDIYKNYSSKFISKDYGDGFGYDEYFQFLFNNVLLEILSEVKSTTDWSGEDGFKLTDNEYNTLNSTLLRDNVHYLLYRVFVNTNDINKSKINMLGYDKRTDSFIDPTEHVIYEGYHAEDTNEYLYKNITDGRTW